MVPRISAYFLDRCSNCLFCETKSTKSLGIVFGRQRKGSNIFKPAHAEPQRCRSPSWVTFQLSFLQTKSVFQKLFFVRQRKGSDIPIGSPICFLQNEIRLSRNGCQKTIKKLRHFCTSDSWFQKSRITFWVGFLICFMLNKIGPKFGQRFWTTQKKFRCLQTRTC